MAKKELTIVYHNEARAMSDSEAMDWAKETAGKFNAGSDSITAYIANAIAIDAVRFLIATDVLDHEEVVFQYDDKKIHPNRYGAVQHWPKGFCDTHNNIIEGLLIAAIKKHRRK